MFSERREIIYNGTHSTNQPHTLYYSNLASLLLHILQDSVSCGTDGLLGDAHDAANVAVFQAHLEEDEKEGVVGCHGSVFLLTGIQLTRTSINIDTLSAYSRNFAE